MPIAQTCEPGATILVVDDDVLVRIAIAEHLRDCGYRVIEAAGGQEARSVLMHGPEIQILFADARLAGDDSGFAIAQWVRSNRPRINVILSTGLLRKSEAASKLCSHHDAASPASHLRERIETMSARHKRRIRNQRPKGRLA